MKRTARSILATVFAVGICGLSLMAPAAAADLKPRMTTVPGLSLPFARTERAQSVWASSACQRDCGAYCAWGQTQCLYRDAQGQCLKLTDDCDRTCQRTCRTSGGPLLPLDF